ncbi:MAG: 50S ribosomal protein L6, partial [Candidatus Colwellbacteria bacterium]|nr:50S ribosomal protein L6 [Candidatus Colwellbacteria bacterium]
MSKIGKKPIEIPEDVAVTLAESVLVFAGKNARRELAVPRGVRAELDGKSLAFFADNNLKQTRANWGTTRALAMNALQGAQKDFMKELHIEGVGFRAQMDAGKLVLNIGFSHPVVFLVPDGVAVSVEKNIIKVSGSDKFLVGETAARIRALKKPEPYKG